VSASIVSKKEHRDIPPRHIVCLQNAPASCLPLCHSAVTPGPSLCAGYHFDELVTLFSHDSPLPARLLFRSTRHAPLNDISPPSSVLSVLKFLKPCFLFRLSSFDFYFLEYRASFPCSAVLPIFPPKRAILLFCAELRDSPSMTASVNPLATFDSLILLYDDVPRSPAPREVNVNRYCTSHIDCPEIPLNGTVSLMSDLFPCPSHSTLIPPISQVPEENNQTPLSICKRFPRFLASGVPCPHIGFHIPRWRVGRPRSSHTDICYRIHV